ncbi:uncharacterized protein LOC144655214 isoform X2 [Oculina patagonica]
MPSILPLNLLFKDIKKNNYQEELEAAGVQMIQKNHVSVQTKIALGRPYSGDVYNATWTQNRNKIDVVLRYDLGPAQRELFIREAKIMASLQHEYIMKFYGAVILGSYADSVGLVVELFSKGNLEEFRVPSLFHAWLYASQLSSALEYLESKNLIHTSVVEPFVYISSLEKISIGGFMCCYYEEELDKTRHSGYQGDLLLSAITGHQGHRLDDFSLKGVVAMFSHLVFRMFRYLDSHRSSQLLELFPGNKKWPLVCPSGIASLLDRCLDEDVNNRPAFQEIVQVLAKERPVKLCFTTSNSSAEPCELSYEEGEKVWVISQPDTERYHGMWFGQKENGIIGFFESEKAIKTDDDDQVPLEIRARGIEAELAYKVALLEGMVKVCRARLLVIGQDRTGKTSLTKSLIGLPFNPEEPSTEVLEMNSSKLEVSVEQVVEWTAINDDSEAEQARPQDMSIARLVAENMMQKKENKEGQISPEEEKEMNYERNVAGPTQMNGMTSADDSSAMPNSPHEPSRSEDVVDGFEENLTQNPITMPRELTALVTECLRNPSDDDATETVLDIWDFAGQHLYYATHPIFFTHRAIYLLVHNLQKNPNDLAVPSFKCGDRTKPLENTSNETNLDMLLSWLVSVHSIRSPPTDHKVVQTCKSKLQCLPPPVLVVGTHADQVLPQEAEQVESQIASSIRGKTYQEHVLGPFYRVDNTQSSNSPDVKEIQARVQQILSSGLNSTADLPVKWFNFEKAVKNLAGEKFFMTLEEIGQVAQQECFIDDDKQLDAMLNYYHDLGLIVRFKDTVVVNTQWLINLFKKLITTCPFQEQVPVDRKLWQELEETGVLHMQLIDKVFEDLHGNGGKSLQQSVLDMMEKYGFLAKFHHHEESSKQTSNSCSSDIKYFVPAQLRVSRPELWKLAPLDSDPCSLVVKFCDGFVPHGLFPQLVSRLIALSSKLECTQVPKLYCNGAHFILGKKSQFDLVLLCSKHCIKLVLKGYNADSQQVAASSLAIQVRTLIEQELASLCQQWHWLGNVEYDLCVSCSACLSSSAECERHKSASCLDQDCMHMLPISSVAVEPVTSFTCPEQVGEHSRFTLTNLHKWYSSKTSEEKPPENDHKPRRIADVDFLSLADKIPDKWKKIGRLLDLEDCRISQIEIDKAGDVYEQCYAMLKAWKESQQDLNATCEQLIKALSHEIVKKTNLVPIYCYLEN